MALSDDAKAALEARMLVENPLYEAYRDGLEEKRAEALRRLLRRGQPYETMTRLAGEVSAIDHALGLPAFLMGDPEPSEKTP